jgi:hypothetical protein
MTWWRWSVLASPTVDDADLVLIQDFVQIKAPYATARDVLHEPTPRWLTAPPPPTQRENASSSR